MRGANSELYQIEYENREFARAARELKRPSGEKETFSERINYADDAGIGITFTGEDIQIRKHPIKYAIGERKNSMPTLYEITDQFRSIFSALEENHGELTEEISAQMGGLETDLEAKIDGYCKRIKDLEGDAAKFKIEEQRITTRRKSMDREVDSLKNWVKVNLKAIGRTEVKTDIFSVKIQKSPAAVSIYDKELIPDQFKMALLDLPFIELPSELIAKAQIRVNKTMIAAVIKGGGDMPGAVLESGDYLLIR